MSNFLVTSTITVNQLMIAQSLNIRVDNCIWWYNGSIYITQQQQQQKAPILKYMLIPSRLKPSHRINKNKSISYNDTLHVFYAVHTTISSHQHVSSRLFRGKVVLSIFQYKKYRVIKKSLCT
jgi:hypothetical protein